MLIEATAKESLSQPQTFQFCCIDQAVVLQKSVEAIKPLGKEQFRQPPQKFGR